MSDYVQDDVDLDDIEYAAVAFDGEVLVRERAILVYQGEYGYFLDNTYIDACIIDKDYRGQSIGSKFMKFFDKKSQRSWNKDYCASCQQEQLECSKTL